MGEKTVVTQPAVRILGNPEENKKVLISSEHSIDDSTNKELKKTQAFPIIKGGNKHTFVTGQMPKAKYNKIKAKRRLQKRSRKNNR